MPSSTFFNLPEAKRQKLLDAASEEFKRVPLTKASINRIIQNAGIPRGSFYMYFEDKIDLFQYLYSSQCARIYDEIALLIKRCNGDLFDGLLRLFDLLIPAPDHSARPEWIADIYHYFKVNGGTSFISAFGLKCDEPLHQPAALLPHVDMTELAISPEDTLIVIELLISNLGWLIGQSHMNVLSPQQARAHFIRSLSLLRCAAHNGLPLRADSPEQ